MTASAFEDGTATPKAKQRVLLFGHFGGDNFGNEATLLASLYHLRRLAPTAELTCICTRSDAAAAMYGIPAIPIRTPLVKRWNPSGSFTRAIRKLVFVIPHEIGEWLRSLRTLGGVDALIVPGSGILQDSATLLEWGPYDMFRWSLAAKLRGCKLVFLSVGAGPLYTRAGRFLVKTALRVADYRSYRDESTRQYLKQIWLPAGTDPVYPDLAFSLPKSLLPTGPNGGAHRPVVSLGLMIEPGRYGSEQPNAAAHQIYLEALAAFTRWLLAGEYDLRLVVGDVVDKHVIQEFTSLMQEQGISYEENRVIAEPAASTEEFLQQLAAADFVVATRFHNALLALLLKKPVLAISFHHKCTSLMSQMGLSKYCLDITRLDSAQMIERFLDLSTNWDSVGQAVAEQVGAHRDALNKQYDIAFGRVYSP